MDQIKQFLTNNFWLTMILIGLFVLFVIYIVLRIYRNALINKVHAIEIDINTLRSTPLSYKLNKAVGLTKVNQEVVAQVEENQKTFAEVSVHFDRLVHLLGNAEDDLLTNKLSSGRQTINEISELYASTAQQVQDLDTQLDRLLEEETRLRDSINELKNEFRETRKQYTKKMNSLTIAQTAIEQTIHDIEIQFNTFEEWMYGSEFKKATDVKQTIEQSIEGLNQHLQQLPKLIELGQGIIPHLTHEVKKAEDSAQLKGVYLEHLELAKYGKVIDDQTREDMLHIENLLTEGILERMTQAQKRLEQLLEAIRREDTAFDQVEGLSATLFSQQDHLNQQISTLTDSLPQLKVRFGFDDLDQQTQAMSSQADYLSETRDRLKAKLEQEQVPYSALLVEFNEYLAAVSHLQTELQGANRLVSNARHDEQRAIKQLLKLNLIMNEIQVKIDSRNLPHIANNYSGDMYKARNQLFDIKAILELDPLNIKLLNSSVSETIDFVYRLYNNVNNLVGTVDMVENAIVYANRFRSSYADLDSELTRAEVLFKNGEYTLALKSAIFAIEKLQPNTPYEQMIMDNSRSA